MQLKFILILLTILAFMAFTGENWQIINFTFFSFKKPVPLPFLVLVALLSGFILSTIISSIKHLKLLREIKNLKKRIEKQNEEIKKLRYFQIKDENENSEIGENK